ncbi:LuxR C-terminal-related transcriptional regulator [Actinomadura bangladeshensis]|uniref:LuxR family transcriptional regulator n=1 Tax=Actinomadura bangladeshensis TaxID=453573 RepID=A0A4R4PCR0_9ACTN|nr:LuxR family transcriptional regulator [Actinomadura bangladeshensis]TDC18853.1 LuxR family transcriptional regulator [Actinomadura bangladeshensis]
MTQRVRVRATAALGRADVLGVVRDHLAAGGGVVLTGPVGIGKSTLFATLAAEHAAAGYRIFACCPAETEHRLPFLGLIDLISQVADEVIDRLPDPERHALRSALLLQDVPTGERDLLCLRLGLLHAFRTLCADRPGLVLIDDAQWLDRPTGELLAFVARRAARLAPPLRMVASVRPEPGPGGPGEDGGSWRDAAGLCPKPVLTVRVPPMSVPELAVLLGDRFGRSWPRAQLARIHEVSGGNPFFAVELARSVLENPQSDELLIPQSLSVLIRKRVAALSPATREALLVASAASRPSVELLRRTGRAGLAEAERRGIVDVDSGGQIRFTHPLLSAVIYAEAESTERKAVHRALSQAVRDPVERALHLARLAPGRDRRIADTLDGAAAVARRRGGMSTAAHLGELAADHTPEAARGTAVARRLRAAEDAVAAGDYPLARRLARLVLEMTVRPEERVRAWIVVLDSSGQALAEVEEVFPKAMEDARGEPLLLAPLHYRLSWRAWMVRGSARAAHVHARRSAELAALAGDRRTELFALSKQANIELFLGHPDAERTLRRALADPQEPQVMWHHNGPVYLKHRHHLMHDRVNEARAELRALIYSVRQRGVVESLCMCLYCMTQVEIYQGRCRQALALARQSLDLAEDSGLSQGPSWYALALAEAAGGDLGRALSAAEQAVQHSADDGDQLFLPRALHAEGLVRWQLGDAAAAARVLGRVRALETGQGLGDPSLRRWHADLADALVAVGRVAEAAALVAETRARAARLGRRGVLAVLERSAALVRAAEGDHGAADDGLVRAAELLQALPYRLEEGRAWLELGMLRARRDDPARGRADLLRARRVFAKAEAKPWLARTQAELQRLDLDGPVRRTSGDDALGVLSDVERRVAALVAEGATNREIAARLFLSTKTVEAALTRTFRKLGVRSRVDVARLAVSGR